MSATKTEEEFIREDRSSDSEHSEDDDDEIIDRALRMGSSPKNEFSDLPGMARSAAALRGQVLAENAEEEKSQQKKELVKAAKAAKAKKKAKKEAERRHNAFNSVMKRNLRQPKKKSTRAKVRKQRERAKLLSQGESPNKFKHVTKRKKGDKLRL